ncbi:MAG TPA: hypothetical protein EYP43_04250, partial [Thermoplasmata archaeon]|nr:hypothetical protein [Thermoplasmata archaeon]
AVWYEGGLMTVDRGAAVDKDIGEARLVILADEERYEGGPQITEVLPHGSGSTGYNFTVLLPPGRFTAVVNHTKGTDLYLLETPLENGTLEMLRHFHVSGRVYFDRDGDGRRDSNEGMEGVTLRFTGDVVENVTSGPKGRYETFLPYGDDGRYNITVVTPGYEGTPDPRNIRLPVGDEHIEIFPLYTHVTGMAFFDEDLDGVPDAGEEIALEHLEFIPKVEGRNASVRLDGPSYETSLLPGSYVVHAYSTGHAALFPVDVDVASGQTIDINMTPSAHVEGTIYYQNLTGEIRIPSPGEQTTDLTFTRVGESDARIVVPLTISSYEVTVPAGEYRVNVAFEVEEYRTVRKYTVNRKIQFKGDGVHDIELERKEDRSIALKWLDEPARVYPNTTVTYHLKVTNRGNVLSNRVTLSKSSGPKGWKVTFDGNSTRTVELGMNESVVVDVQIALPEDAKAGEDRVRIKAVPEGDEDARETESMVINVTAVYGLRIDIIFPDRGIVAGNMTAIDFVVLNEGNVDDTFELEIPAMPDGFTMRVENSTFQPMTDTTGDGRIDTGVVKAHDVHPIFLNITANESATGLVSIPIKVTSVGSGIVQRARVSVQVTLPDLRVELEAEEDEEGVVYLNATIVNEGIIPVEGVEFHFYMDGLPIGENETIMAGGNPLGNGTIVLPVLGNETLSLKYNVTDPGSHTFSFSARPAAFPDLTTEDNFETVSLEIGAPAEGGKGGEEMLTYQMAAVAVAGAVLLVAYLVYRHRRRW